MKVGQCPLTHASVSVVKSWFLDNPTGLESVSSCDIMKALFGIPGANPTPVDITDKLCHAAGDLAFRSMLVNKSVKGDIWEFTTDFGLTTTVSKIWHESTGKFSYGILVSWNEDQNGEVVRRVRPIAEYTARGVKYFTSEDTTTSVVEEEKHDTDQHPAVQDTVQEPEQAPGSEEDAGTAADPTVETPASSDDTTSEDNGDESMTSVENITDDDGEMEDDEDMSNELFAAFAESFIMHLKENGPVTDDKVLSGFRMVIPACKVLISRNQDSGSIAVEPGKVVITANDEDDGNVYTAKLDDWAVPSTPEQPATEEPIETEQAKPEQSLDKFSCWIDSDLRIRDSNKLLNKAYELLGSGAVKDLVQLEDGLEKFVDEGKCVRAHIEGDSIRIKVEDVDDEMPMQKEEPASETTVQTEDQPEQETATETVDNVVFPQGSFVTFDIVGDDSVSIQGMTSDTATIICDTGLVASVATGVVYRVLNDITRSTIACFSDAKEFLKNFAEEIKEEPTTETGAKLTKVTVVNKATTPVNDGDLTTYRDRLLELIPQHSSVEDLAAAMNKGADPKIVLDITYDESDENWTVTMNDNPDYNVDSTEEVTEERVEDQSVVEELQEAMTSDKNTTPVTIDPNYIDLNDRETRDRVIQVLFPGVTDPAITHLLNFLRDYHTTEETKSFIETKGTIPTETCIVYTNLTFSIVKMKDGRYWRIFCANTDYGLDNPTWLATKHMYGRWHQLGHDISNTTDYVRESKNGPTWRRKNNNF